MAAARSRPNGDRLPWGRNEAQRSVNSVALKTSKLCLVCQLRRER